MMVMKSLNLAVVLLLLFVLQGECRDIPEWNTLHFRVHGSVEFEEPKSTTANPKQYYLRSAEKVNWHQASIACNNNNQQLAIIKNETEMMTIDKLIKDKKLEASLMWIGGTDLAKEGTFTWFTTGEPFTYTKWSAGQPDNAGGNENCVHLWTKEGLSYFNDNGCHQKLHFICEDKDK